MATALVGRAILAAVSVASVVILHELVHFITGRMVGVPAMFTGLTSAGISHSAVKLYAGWRLAVMNGSAPLFTVLAGFAAMYILRHGQHLPERARYFISWWAVFGIPYLGLQMMIVVASVDYSGNGVDSAAVAGFLHAGPLALAIVSVAGFLYFMGSSYWVLRAVQYAAGDRIESAAEESVISAWRYIAACLLILVAVSGSVRFALLAFGRNETELGLLEAFAGWTVACALLARWQSPAARAVWSRWLIPGAIGMFALIPFGLIGHGNDFAQLWLFELPPVVAAAMLAGQTSFADRALTRPRGNQPSGRGRVFNG